MTGPAAPRKRQSLQPALGKRLRTARLARRRTQASVALEAGIHLNAYIKIELAYAKDLRVSTLCKIADALSVRVDWLLGGGGEPSPLEASLHPDDVRVLNLIARGLSGLRLDARYHTPKGHGQ